VVLDLELPVPKPGTYQVRVAVRDASASKLGSANQLVSVPDLSKRRLALSGVVLGSVTAAASAESAEVVVAPEDDPDLTAAVRRFRPGTEISYAYAVYHPAIDAKGDTHLQSRVRLLRGNDTVLETPLADVRVLQALDTAASKGGPKVKPVPGVVVAGRLRLPADLPQGEYGLQVLVTDGPEKGKPSAADQWAAFEVVPAAGEKSDR